MQNSNQKYNRTNWVFQNRGNPGWKQKIDDLVIQAAAQAVQRDVMTMKLCYIDTEASWDYYRQNMEKLMADYPTKTFVWWRWRELNPRPGKHFEKNLARDRIFFTLIYFGEYSNRI